jgi:hypothetical protein
MHLVSIQYRPSNYKTAVECSTGRVGFRPYEIRALYSADSF